MNIYEKTIQRFGPAKQTLKCLEEMGELTQAIIKCLLNPALWTERAAHIEEEIADVSITLEQLKIMFPGWKNQEKIKLKRLQKLITQK